MRTPLPRRRTKRRRGLRLWSVGTVLVLTFTAAILVAAAVFYTGWDLLGARELQPEHRIDSKTLFDLVKLSFGVVAGAGALVALIVAYRRQRVDEDGALRETTRLHTERFTAAVAQLGQESAAVRLGGVHALAGLADDAPTRALRQTCIDVLCAYLRLPYTAEADLPTGDAGARHGYLALREVRHTIIRLIGDHLRLEAKHPNSWRGHDFDLTEVTFDGGDLSWAVFASGRASFREAVFTGSVDFRGATFSGSTIDFHGAVFAGSVDFRGATFSGSTVEFDHTRFEGGSVQFDHTRFEGGSVYFRWATFSGGIVHFDWAVFAGSTVRFIGTVFVGSIVHFSQATFSGGAVYFAGATFSGGAVYFAGATFSGGTVHFAGATFSGGTVHFGVARFEGGSVSFDRAAFSGATVDLSYATGAAPDGLPSSGGSLPTGLALPSAWYTAGS
ncbi:pentapeptide repeat-containing protein [Streptomyces ochraceiscleroticus]|uniref:Pentapeptide repeat-containing protein n=1 Tax=Streptomyces ochraceiscleroticus TaxID=47761 RepID=A0ABW1MM19_9ACTN|nr:pentapeptide repeat-containing protein [Streptomyces ochraceiscleroticus]